MTIDRLTNLINAAHKIVFFTGAGVSTESGIPDFRGKKGLYRKKVKEDQYTPEEILSCNYWQSNPKEFFDYYDNVFLKPLEGKKPNYAHKFIADLEQSGKNVTVVTQNVDTLHQQAGTKNIITLHGNSEQYACACSKQFNTKQPGNKCECGEYLRPCVILFGDPLSQSDLKNAVEAIAKANLLIVIGTSLQVYPAAALIRSFRGDNMVLINNEPTDFDSAFDLVIRENAGEFLRKIT